MRRSLFSLLLLAAFLTSTPSHAIDWGELAAKLKARMPKSKKGSDEPPEADKRPRAETGGTAASALSAPMSPPPREATMAATAALKHFSDDESDGDDNGSDAATAGASYGEAGAPPVPTTTMAAFLAASALVTANATTGDGGSGGSNGGNGMGLAAAGTGDARLDARAPSPRNSTTVHGGGDAEGDSDDEWFQVDAADWGGLVEATGSQ